LESSPRAYRLKASNAASPISTSTGTSPGPDAPRLAAAIDIPTGLGKTSIIAIWLLALAAQAADGAPSLPRRLVYVVNRRTVVDQASDVAARIRSRLLTGDGSAVVREIRALLTSLSIDPDLPVAISTLRGELADNREWQADPARPAIIIGTIDMIGSRLLFSGYGAGGSYRRAQAAGLIGYDSLIVHDEAHLSPAFSRLIRHVANLQMEQDGERRLRVMELSATQRSDEVKPVFRLEGDDWKETVVDRRVNAKKAIYVNPIENADRLVNHLVETALRYRDDRVRVLIYVQKPELASKVVEALQKKPGELGTKRVGLLTGTLRGYERDRLVLGKGDDSSSSVFAEFRAADTRVPPAESLFLVSTSAGEVGIDLDADHLVCDLSTLDSMIQRLGRVNRLGRDEANFVARIDVLSAPDDKGTPEKIANARRRTHEALQQLARRPDGGVDASPGALRDLFDRMGADRVFAAFAPVPRLVPCTDILLDTWALTSVHGVLPGRPPVERWLHGVPEYDPPETTVVWRLETVDLAKLLAIRRQRHDAEQWFDTHRILAQERLRDVSARVARQVKKIAERTPEEKAILISSSGNYAAITLSDATDERRLAFATLILPPEVGGFEQDTGTLNGGNVHHVVDVADANLAHRDIDPAHVGDINPARMRLRVLIERTDDDSWSVQALGLRHNGLTKAIASFNPASTSIDGIIEELLCKLNQSLDPTKRFVEKGVPLTVEEDEDGACRVLVSIGVARTPETALDNSAGASKEQKLDDHLAWAEIAAQCVAARAGLSPQIASALALAAQWHDKGKGRAAWQTAIYNRPPRPPLAKTDHGRWKRGICDGYRHELGSLIEAATNEVIKAHPEYDLILHMIASHHGWARPHFETQAIDPDADDDQNAAAMADAMRRFARLQRRFGRWGLAWLEALMKATDAIASVRGKDMETLPS
jgi:CRISPR-associated endonuclease/helicase Cas3